MGKGMVRMMVQDGINGFCMALADSVPGVSGGTVAFLMGFYDRLIGAIHDLAFGKMEEKKKAAIKAVLSMEFSYLPSLMFFGGGVLIGSVTVVKAIRECLQRFRPQTIWLILGMMVGSLYAIEMGPTTLEMPKDPLQIGNFHPLAAAVGILLTLGMQKLRERQEKRDGKEELTG